MTKLTPVLKALRGESQRARDKFAEKAFELETVRHAIHQAAARGQRSFRLKVPDTMGGLDQTDAGQALNTWCRSEGIALTWEKRMADFPDEGRRSEVVEPEFSW